MYNKVGKIRNLRKSNWGLQKKKRNKVKQLIVNIEKHIVTKQKMKLGLQKAV